MYSLYRTATWAYNAENLLGYYTAASKLTRKDSNDPAPSILHIYIVRLCFRFFFFFFTIVLHYSFFYLANLPYKTSEKNYFTWYIIIIICTCLHVK